jgi:hypothetical protein
METAKAKLASAANTRRRLVDADMVPPTGAMTRATDANVGSRRREAPITQRPFPGPEIWSGAPPDYQRHRPHGPAGSSAIGRGPEGYRNVSPGRSSCTFALTPRFASSSRSCAGVPAKSGNVPKCIGITSATPNISTASAADRGSIV